MKAEKLYQRLDHDFIKSGLTDDWAQYMSKVYDFLSDNFKKRSMGLVCDNTHEVKRVYTAVFPTDKVLRQILGEGHKDALIFVHHPSNWDITTAPKVFHNMNPKLLVRLRESRISIYNLHVPLDNFGKYSTSFTLARALGLVPQETFAPYRGGMAGVIGISSDKTVIELSKRFRKAVGHRVKLYPYGDPAIKNQKVAVVAGGGNEIETLEDLVKRDINTFVTGITAFNDHSKKEHEFAKQYKINILGGTHYSTEKFACMEMCKYFRELGLPCKFIEGKPGMGDL